MAATNELIRERLLDSTELKVMLTTYCDEPAVFYQTAPSDKDEGWNDTTQYPRIEFTVEQHAEAEYDTAGKLHIDITCTETGTPPEDVEPLVRRVLAGVFFYPDGKAPFTASWDTSMTFQTASQADNVPLLIGITVDFNLVSFPNLETSDPDPVAAINRYAGGWDKALTIVDRAEVKDYFIPTRDKPAAYFRKLSATINRETNTVTWMDAVLVAHFFAPELKDRCEWIEQFAQQLALDTEVTMLDGSPMFIHNIKGNSAWKELQGQGQIFVEYGLLRRPKYAHTMTQMRLNQKGGS